MIVMNYWLVKQEPEAYAWKDFLREGKTAWTGVRNYQARNALRQMQKDDLVLFYHSVSEKSIVGIAKVLREAYPDPTAKTGDWSCVDLKPVKPFSHPVTLSQIKETPSLASIPLIRQSRLSVMALTRKEFTLILSLGKTHLP